MSCEQCFTRRGFLAKSALAAAALAVAEGCGDGQIGPVIPHSSGGDPDIPSTPGVTVVIANFSGLATVGTVVDIKSERALVRTGPTTFKAFSKLCTHQQCETDVRNNRFECPCHGSIFAADGSVVRGPNVANSGITPLRALATTYDAVKGTVSVA